MSVPISQLKAVSHAEGVPVALQLTRAVHSRILTGVTGSEYFAFRLWRNSLSTADRLSYLCIRQKDLNQSVTNWGGGPPHPQQGKSQALDRVAPAGVTTPELLATIGAGSSSDQDRRVASFSELLRATGGRPFVLKPELGRQGSDVLVVRQSDSDSVTLANGDRVAGDEMWTRLTAGRHSAWRVERWVQPHGLVAAWSPGTTTTVRLLTLMVGGTPVVHAASIKVPIKDTGVDNMAQGNLAASVDLATGRVGAATDKYGTTWHTTHPSNGAPIDGIVVPDWSGCIEMVCRCAAEMMPYRAIGWDVAVGSGGPVVLEANARWGVHLLQTPSSAGLVRGAYIRLLHEVGGQELLSRRRWSSQWRAFERRALDGGD